MQVTKDGSLVVDELITYAFSGPFSGGYREIPLRAGESIDQVARQRERPRLPAGRLHRARLRRRPGHVRDGDRLGQRAHRLALPGQRRAAHVRRPLPAQGRRRRLRRRRRRQPQGLGLGVEGAARPTDRDRDRRPARSCAPGAIPSTSAATSSSTGKRAVLRALDVPAGQFVELRTVIPRSAFTLDRRDAGRRGQRPRRRSSPRRRPTQPRSRRTASGSRTRSSTRGATPSILLLLGHDPGVPRRRRRLLVLRARAEDAATTASTSRSRRPTPSRRSSRPSLRQGGEAGSFEFTATLFDLIRRGVFTSTPVTTERSTWGGLRTRERLRSRALGRQRRTSR